VIAVSNGSGQATVTWTAPLDNGSPIQYYTVTPYQNGVALTPIRVDAPSTTVTVFALQSGTFYTFDVTATNMMGTSPPGTSNPVLVA
jgi:hypothetical protein